MKKSNKLLIIIGLANLCFLTACFFTFKTLIANNVSTTIHVFIGLMELFVFFHVNCCFLFLRLPMKTDKNDDTESNLQQTLAELKIKVIRNAGSLEKINKIMQGKQLVNLSESMYDLLSSVQSIFDSTLNIVETIENRIKTDKTYQNI